MRTEHPRRRDRSNEGLVDATNPLHDDYMAYILFLYVHSCCQGIIYIASVTYINLTSFLPSLNHFNRLQLTRQKLRPAHPKTPILLFVSSHTDYQICLWNSTFFFQSLC